MQADTTMSAAFQKAGLSKRQMRLYKPLTEFLSAGGTREELLAVWGAIQKLPDEGQICGADKATQPLPSSRQQNGGGGAAPKLPQGQASRAQPSPAREPDKGAIVAMAEARRKAATAIFAVNGIDIRNFTIGACLSEGRRKGKEHYILSVIGGMFKHLPHTMHVGEVMSDDDLKTLVRQAEAFANAA